MKSQAYELGYVFGKLLGVLLVVGIVLFLSISEDEKERNQITIKH